MEFIGMISQSSCFELVYERNNDRLLIVERPIHSLVSDNDEQK